MVKSIFCIIFKIIYFLRRNYLNRFNYVIIRSYFNIISKSNVYLS